MSYVDQSRRPSAASMAAVIGVHAALAAVLVAGLTVSGAIPKIITDIDAVNIPVVPPPPPVDPVEPVEPSVTQPTTPPLHVPQPKFELAPAEPTVPTTPLVLPPVPTPQPGLRLDPPAPSPMPSFDPVGAKPRNDPARWLSNDDYRPSWARRELTGTARFRLEIAASGKVTGCSITGSTGHAELDQATCKLVTRRARFEPARGGNGEPVAGRYDGSVRWVLPD